MTPPSETFDEVHVVSDLHLGGGTGFQIFGSTAELVWLVNDLRQRRPKSRVALVINGDFVDFLAQAPTLPFDPEGATAKLAAIATASEFVAIFVALRQFTATGNRQLIVNLGNHDLELALPWMREQLLAVLAGDDRAARGRITLAFDGAGVAMQVGGARVLCVHGNEVDSWNVADYEHIRKIGLELTQGRCADPWVPNGGSQLVTDVMNPLKREFPFIDLLKPEMPAVFPTLLALRPAVAAKLTKLSAAFARSSWDALRMKAGFLEGEPGGAAQVSDASVTNPPESGRHAARRKGNEDLALALFDRTEKLWREDTYPIDLVGGDQSAEYLGMIGGLVKLMTGKGPIEALRDALEKLDEDVSFDPSEEDATFRDLDKTMSGDFGFLIAGHTHLERALKRHRGNGYYFNSGTWARLMRIPREVRQDESAFNAVYERMKAGSMAALDGTGSDDSLTMRRCSVVSIWCESRATVAELRRVAVDAASFKAQPVQGTRFSIT